MHGRIYSIFSKLLFDTNEIRFFITSPYTTSVMHEEIILLTLWDSDCRSVVDIVLIAGIAGAGMTGENVFTHISIQIYQRTVYH